MFPVDLDSCFGCPSDWITAISGASSDAEEIRHDDSLAETLLSSETTLFSSLTIRQSGHRDP
jgi:hypothetical protein